MNNDLISRQAAIDALNEYFARIGKLERGGLTEGEKAISLDTVGTIKTLPPAQPERAAGEWIVHLYKVGVSRYECDTCHARCDIMYPYCPYCGEKKEGERYAIN